MPHVPKWMGDVMENLLASKLLHLRVTDTTPLSTAVRLVRFTGDLRGASNEAGYAMAFRVNGTEFRNYTPSLFLPEKGICEVIFHLHGNGPGSEYASKLTVGDTLKVSLPRGRKLYRENPYHFFFGDETTLGVYKGLQREVTRQGGLCTGILELDAANAFLPGDMGLTTDIVDKGKPDKADHLGELLDKNLGASGMPADAFLYYLMGNARSIQSFRNILKARGVQNRNIRTQAYWAPGKRGL
ncbi:siderophore-interacting protein [Chitinophaga sp. XS-30]|uniref:siderophore-interacting protein n=1 Tax=Chitinophaga sp. XS-30 TaxID=2604421 RepID=UPI0011DDF5B1|nr:SIP domain-containing protein [Chitinophaga sp. XS-30]QEH43016.1 hypothetical protein FW415_19935 [Chitinophaga sp. XS-30]